MNVLKEDQHAYSGWVYAGSCPGQKVLNGVGMTGIPVFTVNDKCFTESNALFGPGRRLPLE